jgi:hypothetical protein
MKVSERKITWLGWNSLGWGRTDIGNNKDSRKEKGVTFIDR